MDELSEATIYHLKILAKPTNASSSGWEVAVYLGGACFARKIELSDPFSEAEEEECRWFLEDYLRKSPYEKGRAEVVAESLQTYADSLFEQLHLRRVLRRLAGPTNPSHKILEIDIVENADNSNTISSETIHRFHWELLELPRLWKSLKMRATVRRVIPQKEITILSIKRVESWSRGVPAVNVLLVVARKLVQNAKTHDDIDPNQVYYSLQTIKQDLKGRGAPFRLNIEIVRPGSFIALKKHLDERSKLRRDGDIHIVHFDVHGRVGLPKVKGDNKVTKTAFLYFSSRTVDFETSPVRAGTVAELLRKHNIRIVVLSACESAKASQGDEANLARTFTQAGVQNVLAMSYMTLSTACTVFMRCFYDSLISKGKPFSTAVGDAREMLRSSPTREARFGLNKPLEDWIVPVVYASGKDVELRISGTTDQGVESEPQKPNAVVGDKDSLATDLVGRGFDVLRFETKFFQSNIIGLSGPAGIGKTAFIHHLVQYWKDTGLCEEILYVDCSSLATGTLSSPEILLQNLLNRNRDSSDQDATVWSETDYRSTIKQLRDTFQVIVLDNMEASHSEIPEMTGHGRWPESTRAALIDLIKDIVSIESEGEHASFVLVGRREDDNWWKKHFSELPRFPRYCLTGLSLPDAIELAHRILGEAGTYASQWDQKDEEVLSQVLKLLQCNPLAIETVLRTVASQAYPWKEIFEKILFHKFSGFWPVVPNGVSFLRRDMLLAKTAGALEPKWDPVFPTLALYWHQGCLKSTFYGYSGTPQEAPAVKTLEFGVDRGYFLLDERGFIEQIHPLFTIVGRCIFSSGNATLSKTLLWVLESDDDSTPDPFGFMIANLFLLGIATRPLDDEIRDIGVQANFRKFEETAKPAYYNILTCLRLCSLGGLPVLESTWPDALEVYGSAAIWFLSVDEIALIVKHYEQFLRTFLRRRKDPTEVKTLFLMISVGNFLVIAHLMVSSLPKNRSEEFSRLTFDIIDNTEEELLKDTKLTGPVSVAMWYRDMATFIQGKKTLADSAAIRNAIPWSQQPLLDSIKDLTFDELGATLPNILEDGAQIQKFLQSRDMTAHRSDIRNAIRSGVTPLDLATKAANGLSRITSDNASTDLIRFSLDSDPITVRAKLEDSLDVRNRADAIKHYKFLIEQAKNDWNFDVVLELQDSLIEIYRTDELFEADLEGALKERFQFEGMQKFLKLCTSDAETTPEDRSTILESLKSSQPYTPEQQYFHVVVEGLLERATEVHKGGATTSRTIQQPKKHFNQVMEEWRDVARRPEGRERLHQLQTQFSKFMQLLMQEMEAGDFEKALETLDRLIEVDEPSILSSFPRNLTQVRETLVSLRDFTKASDSIIQAEQEDRHTEAMSIVESLIKRHAAGDFPGLPETYIQSLYCNFDTMTWHDKRNIWHAAFDDADFAQALQVISEIRKLETSKSFNQPMSTNIGTFVAQEHTDWSYMRTLHRYFDDTGRPKLALKTLEHLLRRFDYPERESNPGWLTPEQLDMERAHKWLYELEIEKEIFLQDGVQGDFISAWQQIQKLFSMKMNPPERFDVFIHKKALKRIEFEEEQMQGFMGNVFSSVLSQTTKEAGGGST